MLTVGIINHNLGKYLGAAIESAIPEAGRVIVFDDGSTDKSLDVCKEFKQFDVEVVSRETASGSAAWGWNELIAMCETKYFLPLSADDVLVKGAGKRIIEQDADWIYADLDLIDVAGNKIAYYDYKNWPKTVDDCIRYMWFYKKLWPTMIAAFRTDFVKDNGLKAWNFEGMNSFMDTSTGISWLFANPELCYLGEPIIQYRQHPQSETLNSCVIDRKVMERKLENYIIEKSSLLKGDRK